MTDLLTPPPEAATTARKHPDVVPLPKWLTRVYYIFPIVLYIPDMLFNWYVYSNGIIDFTSLQLTDIPYVILWGFLAAGLVGMAWLLSVLAPWHWARRNYFQGIMCWIGVIIATAITVWNSLQYRLLQTTQHFPTDVWFAKTFGFDIKAFSPTTILVSIAPPFWGLFWAIVQPAERRRSREEERESHEMKMQRLRQEAELKKLRAEANAQIRQAQLKGLVATVKSARAQMTGASEEDAPQTTVTTVSPTIIDADPPPGQLAGGGSPPPQIAAPGAQTLRSLPTGEAFQRLVERIWRDLAAGGVDPTIDTLTMALRQQGFPTPQRIDIARALRRLGDTLSAGAPALSGKAPVRSRHTSGEDGQPSGGRPFPGSPAFRRLVRGTMRLIDADGLPVTVAEVARRTEYLETEIQPTFNAIRAAEEAS